jgi:thiol-disulfide isomerase/thioredoxin
MSRKGRRPGSKRNYRLWGFLALVVLTGVVAYYIFTQSGAAGGGSPLDGTPVSQAVLSDLAGVSPSTLSAVGSGAAGITSPTSITSATHLTLNGKPEVLYMGAEFCPYCAAERWAMIVALDKFGNFTGLEYMQSTATDVYASTPTFTFLNATYTSKYISFVSVEDETRAETPLQTATAAETALLTSYDNCASSGVSGGIPFIDFGNSYVVNCGSNYNPGALRVDQNEGLAPYNWTQIASQLNNSSSVFAQNIDGVANRLISAVCKIDGGNPTSICSQGFADTLSYVRTLPSNGSQLVASDAALGVSPELARFAPGRLYTQT